MVTLAFGRVVQQEPQAAKQQVWPRHRKDARQGFTSEVLIFINAL